MTVRIIHGDCREVLKTLASDSLDSCVTDPPYGLSFMGKSWDYDVPGVDVWRDVFRVLKPGAHLLAFFGTRTYHRGVVNIEDAGFEIRDQIGWAYGSGFPKSLDVSKAIDKEAGASRTVVGIRTDGRGASPSKLDNHEHGDTGIGHMDGSHQVYEETAPASDAAKQWSGWGTALKPAWEPIVVARKPLIGTVAENVQKYGTGAINIDGCRVEGDAGNGVWGTSNKTVNPDRTFVGSPDAADYRTKKHPAGRWPANLIHDGSEEVLARFPKEAGATAPVSGEEPSDTHKSCYGDRDRVPGTFFGDNGSAARFFYCAKASRQDRDEYCGELGKVRHADRKKADGSGGDNPRNRSNRSNRNFHPTVKPTALMRYLVKLVTPPHGTVLDPFAGSGSTGKAAELEDMNSILIEIDEQYVELAKKRTMQQGLFTQPKEDTR